MPAGTIGPRPGDDGRPRRALGRRSVVMMLASAVGLIAPRSLARAGTAFSSGGPVAISPARGGAYRGMVAWDDEPRHIAEINRVLALGWRGRHDDDASLGAPDDPAAHVELHYFARLGPPLRHPPVAARVVIVNESLRDLEPPEGDFVISAPLRDMRAVAEAFLRVRDRDGLIAVDLSDLQAVSGTAVELGGRPAIRVPRRARGVSLDGVAPPGPLVPAARDALDRLGEGGFDGGLCVVALVCEGDVPSSSMDGFDAFVAGVTEGQGERAIRRAIIHAASRSTVVLVAFEKHDGRARRGSDTA